MKALAIGLALIAVPANAQVAKKVVPQTKAPVHANKPVTRAQFFFVVDKMRAATDKVLGLPARSGGKPDRPDALLTRSEVIEAFSDLFKAYRSKFLSTPRPLKVDKKALTQRNAAAVQPQLELLVKWGFVAQVGPLVVGPGDSLTAEQAGDALGFFWNQLTLLTTQVDPRWSPRLEPQGGG